MTITVNQMVLVAAIGSGASSWSRSFQFTYACKRCEDYPPMPMPLEMRQEWKWFWMTMVQDELSSCCCCCLVHSLHSLPPYRSHFKFIDSYSVNFILFNVALFHHVCNSGKPFQTRFVRSLVCHCFFLLFCKNMCVCNMCMNTDRFLLFLLWNM